MLTKKLNVVEVLNSFVVVIVVVIVNGSFLTSIYDLNYLLFVELLNVNSCLLLFCLLFDESFLLQVGNTRRRASTRVAGCDIGKNPNFSAVVNGTFLGGRRRTRTEAFRDP